MGAVAHGECQTCGSRAPVELAARIAELELMIKRLIHDGHHMIDRLGGGYSSRAHMMLYAEAKALLK